MNWLDPYQNPLIIFVPLALGFSPIALSLFLAARRELAARAGRHRGTYEFADFAKREADRRSRNAGQVAGLAVEGMLETFTWTGQVMVPDPPDEVGVAYLTITPDEALMSFPVLMTEDRLTDVKAEILAEAHSVLCQHERVYHPVAA